MSNIDIVQSTINAFMAGDTATLDTLLTDDFVFSGPVPQPLDKTAFLRFNRALHEAIPDFNFNPDDWREDGDTVSFMANITGTHTGTLALIPGVPPVPATGKTIHLSGERSSYTVRDGKIARLVVSLSPGGGVPAIYAQVGAPLPS